MNKTNNKRLTPNAKALRKNMTKEERHLWYDFLKSLPVTIHRQKVIGDYIIDFYCASSNLVIELDGSQHYEDKGLITDTVRDNYLESLGLTVLRYSNLDVNKNFSGVCEDILNHISKKPSPLIGGEGKTLPQCGRDDTECQRGTGRLDRLRWMRCRL